MRIQHVALLVWVYSILCLVYVFCDNIHNDKSSKDLPVDGSYQLDESLVLMGTSFPPVPKPGQTHLNFTWGERVAPEKMHRCSFVLKTIFNEPNKDIVDKPLTIDSESLNESEKIVLKYLKRIGAKVKRHSNRFIAAAGPIDVWERAFKTEFYHIYSDRREHELLRCKEYHLPKYVADHVHAVMNTVQIPASIVRRQKENKKKDHNALL